jgi:hypothetical protein
MGTAPSGAAVAGPPKPAGSGSILQNKAAAAAAEAAQAAAVATIAATTSLENVEMLKQRLEEVSGRSHKFAREIERLRAAAKASEAEAEARVKFLQDELTRKEQANKTLTRQVQELVDAKSVDKSATKTYLEATLKRAEELFLSKEGAMLAREKDLLVQLADLTAFKEIREALIAELELTKRTMRESETKHRTQLEELERRFLAARNRLEAEAAEKLTRSKQLYKEEVGQELDLESRYVRTENARLSRELTVQVSVAQQMHKASDKAGKELSQLKLDHSLQVARFEELTKQHIRLRKHAEDVAGKVRTLEDALSVSLRSADTERAATAARHAGELTALQRALEQTRAALAGKELEARALRKHAQVLLDARSEMESFFTDALDAAKQEVLARQRLQYEQAKAAHQSRMRDLARGRGGAATGPLGEAMLLPPLAPSGKVALAELSPEERFGVIRKLYAKVRGVKLAEHVRLPPHTLAPGAAAAAGGSAGGLGYGGLSGDSRPVSAGDGLLPPPPPPVSLPALGSRGTSAGGDLFPPAPSGPAAAADDDDDDEAGGNEPLPQVGWAGRVHATVEDEGPRPPSFFITDIGDADEQPFERVH